VRKLRSRGLAGVLVVRVCLAAFPAGADAWQDSIAAADRAAAEGRFTEAEPAYRAALEAATSPGQEVRTSLALADVLRQQATLGASEDPGSLEEAAALYKSMLEPADGEDRLRAHNNLATVLLQLGRPAEAAAALDAIEPEMRERAPAEAWPVYLYNYGRASEELGNVEQALQRYRDAAAADPMLEPASHSVLRLALTKLEPARGIEVASTLIGTLIKQGEIVRGRDYLRQALFHKPWLEEPAGYSDLVVELVVYLTAARVGPETFAQAWEEDVNALAPHDPLAEAHIERINRSYRDDFPVLLERDAAVWEWGDGFDEVESEEDQSQPLSSAFLKMIGDGYVALGQAEFAFPRYVLAWNLDRANADAGLRMVNLLLELDMGDEPLDQLIAILFEGKGDAYLGQDWPNILRFHTLLGTIFERRGQWGPSTDPRTALFQWERALEAQTRMLQAGYEPIAAVPGLQEKIARAYREVDQPDRAWQHYTDAAEGFLTLRNPEAARVVLSDADALSYEPVSDQAVRINRLKEAVGLE